MHHLMLTLNSTSRPRKDSSAMTNMEGLTAELKRTKQDSVSRDPTPDQRCNVHQEACTADDHDEPLARPTTRSRARAAKVNRQNPTFGRRPSTTHRGFYDPDTPTAHRGLYEPNEPTEETTAAKPSQANRTRIPRENPTAPLIKQPETRPISQEQLVAEVKGIYAGLVMVESKCIEVDNAQSSQSEAKLNNEQWQALIALHRTLLHEHHDFFLASQHPSANPTPRRLAQKYAMPARMWRHRIYSFLELLRYRLPASLEHMLTFIYLAYSMMALLYETVPALKDTWIECLGDLGRYRMAIEDENIRDREVWTSLSRHWYSKASDWSPTTGRLYHHFTILARPNVLQQYIKSLRVPTPFKSARVPIMTPFDPILGTTNHHHRNPSTASSPGPLMHHFLSKKQASDSWSIRLKQVIDTLKFKVNLPDMKNHHQQLSNLEKRSSQDEAYFGAKVISLTTGFKKILLHGLSYAHSNAMISLLGMMLVAPGVSALPIGYKDSTLQSQDTNTSFHEPQWPWHLAVSISTFACLGLSWIFNRRRELGTRDYETWFLIAALLHNVEYGYKAFVEERLESSWR